MSEVCQQPMRDGKDRYGKWRHAICAKVCNQGQRFCPRHIMLNDLAEKTAADKELAKRAAAKAEAVASGKR